jgi:DNA-binding NarL/FixJ family response regulator
MRKTLVLVVDDHTIVRHGISSLLALASDMEVVGEAADGKEAVEKVRQLTPDVVLMDMAMPIMGGLEATRRISREFPGVKIVALTQYDDREHVIPVIQAGACGFVSKCAASSDLAAAIRAATRGESFLSPSVAGLLVQNCQEAGRADGWRDPYEQLTDREREVLKLMVEGHTTLEIADVLVVSPKTVEGHKTKVMAKLDIRNRVDLVKYAIRKGIIPM